MDPNGSSLLAQATLVLNRSWTVVNVTTVKRALCLVFRGHAKIIAPGTFQVHDFASWLDQPMPPSAARIRTVSVSIPAPEVIVLQGYDEVPATEVPFSRRNIFRRDNYQCQYCGKHSRAEELTIDHLVPRSQGGATTWENCVLACTRCNLRKGNRSPEEAGLALRARPRRPRWQPDILMQTERHPTFWASFIKARREQPRVGAGPGHPAQYPARVSHG